MFKPIRTKRELLARIAKGQASVEVVFKTMKVRVAAGGDPDPNAGVWLSATQKSPYIVDDYAVVFARIQGREVRLTPTETDAVVRYVAEAMRQRERVPGAMRRGRRPTPLRMPPRLE